MVKQLQCQWNYNLNIFCDIESIFNKFTDIISKILSKNFRIKAARTEKKDSRQTCLKLFVNVLDNM